MDERTAIELRLASLERKMWALLLYHVNKRDLMSVGEVLELIKAVESI